MLNRNYNQFEIAKTVSLSDKYLIITYPGSRQTKILDTQNVWEVREQAVGGEMGVSIIHGPNLASPDTIKCKCPKPQELIQRVRDLKNRHSWFSYDEILRTSFDIFKLECDEESHPTKLQAFANSLNTTESNKAGLKNIKDKIPNISRYAKKERASAKVKYRGKVRVLHRPNQRTFFFSRWKLSFFNSKIDSFRLKEEK